MPMTPEYVDEMLRRCDWSRNIKPQSEFFCRLMKEDPTKDLAWIEARLREFECENLFLLAVSSIRAPAWATIFDPAQRFIPEYWVWHCVNGSDDRAKTVTKLDRDFVESENINRLKKAGFLTIR